jgi:hypothetical protein
MTNLAFRIPSNAGRSTRQRFYGVEIESNASLPEMARAAAEQMDRLSPGDLVVVLTSSGNEVWVERVAGVERVARQDVTFA